MCQHNLFIQMTSNQTGGHTCAPVLTEGTLCWRGHSLIRTLLPHHLRPHCHCPDPRWLLSEHAPPNSPLEPSASGTPPKWRKGPKKAEKKGKWKGSTLDQLCCAECATLIDLTSNKANGKCNLLTIQKKNYFYDKNDYCG